jgi:hypothetical protein
MKEPVVSLLRTRGAAVEPRRPCVRPDVGAVTEMTYGEFGDEQLLPAHEISATVGQLAVAEAGDPRGVRLYCWVSGARVPAHVAPRPAERPRRAS